MRTGGQWLELHEKILVFLLVTTDRNCFVGRYHVTGSGYKDIKGLGALTQGLDDKGGLLLHAGLVEAKTSGGRFFASSCK